MAQPKPPILRGPAEAARNQTLSKRLEGLIKARRYHDAITVAGEVLEINRKAYGEDNPSTASSLNDLAGIYFELGDCFKALPLFERALEINEKARGPEHPNTAESLRHLALAYSEIGAYAKALPLFERTAEINEKLLGPNDPATLASFDNLIRVGQAMRECSAALLLCERMLRLSEKVLGPGHPDTALSINDLALVYYGMGEYAKALPLFERALSIREKTLGLEHPDTATTLSDLGALYADMGKYVKALPYCKRALAIREKTLGEEHPDTATSFRNLALLHCDMREYARVLPLCDRATTIADRLRKKVESHSQTLQQARAVEILHDLYALHRVVKTIETTKKLMGSQHPAFAQCLKDLADVHETMGKYAMAMSLYRQAFAISPPRVGGTNQVAGLVNLAHVFESLAHGRESAYVAALFYFAIETARTTHAEQSSGYLAALRGLGKEYVSMRDFVNAEAAYRNALDTTDKIYGKKHREYATALGDLSTVCHGRDNHVLADSLSLQSLEVEASATTENDVERPVTLINLAMRYDSNREYAKAAVTFGQAAQVAENRLRNGNPDCYIRAMSGLAYVYCKINEYGKAESLCRHLLNTARTASKEPPGYVSAIETLADCYSRDGQWSRAEPLYRQAVEMTRSARNTDARQYGKDLCWLASCYLDMKRYGQAESLCGEATEVVVSDLKQRDPGYSFCLSDLAVMCRRLRQYEKSVPQQNSWVKFGSGSLPSV
jgi:tetratricopeptide (TPR) repeat protein